VPEADVAFKVNGPDVEGVAADLRLLESRFESALRHESSAFKATGFVAKQVHLALECDIRLVSMEGEDGLKQRGWLSARCHSRHWRDACRERHVGPLVSGRGRVGPQVQVNSPHLKDVGSRAEVQELGRVLTVLPGQIVGGIQAALERAGLVGAGAAAHRKLALRLLVWMPLLSQGRRSFDNPGLRRAGTRRYRDDTETLSG
jgi:hypothetical protein